jgi:hypothetical protein
LSHYEVWRRILNLQSQFQLIATTSSTSYTDNSAFQDSQGQETRYYIKAVNDLSFTSLPSNQYTVYLQTPHKVTNSDSNENLPNEFILHQNYPNPFNPSTEIRFDLPESAQVQLSIFDVMGREVARLVEETMEAGSHQVSWNASNLSSGVYVIHINAGSFIQSRSMVLLK